MTVLMTKSCLGKREDAVGSLCAGGGGAQKQPSNCQRAFVCHMMKSSNDVMVQYLSSHAKAKLITSAHNACWIMSVLCPF